MKKILILAANPKDTQSLRLDEEVRTIQEKLKRSKLRDDFEIVSCWAVRIEDLQQALLDENPQIVHFLGHGAGKEGLALEDGQGRAKLVSSRSLAKLFKFFQDKVECVLLNACYSSVQAEVIYQHIDTVIGMKQAIGDQAAVKFAGGFYSCLGAGRSYRDAYEFGCNAIDLEGLPDHLVPVLQQRVKTTAQAHVFISYRSEAPDQALAEALNAGLQQAGHRTFMAAASLNLGDNWPQRIDQELERCDYFILLLSAQSATSEMVTEEVRRARDLRDQRSEPRPIILPIRVNFPMDSPLNYELRGYLNRIQQREWRTPDDTQPILAEVLKLLANGEVPAPIVSPESAPILEETPDQPPLPVAEPDLMREPGGVVSLKSSLYVERPPIEADCFAEIEQPGALIRIKAPRQMGKTSLMARILHHAQAQGYAAIPLSFQRADNQLFSNLDQFLRWFCEQVGRKLKKFDQIDEFWSGFGSKDKCNAYFEECLLEELDQPLVLGLDEVDLVFPHRQVADDFFGLLRSWYESARYGDMGSELWSKLRLVVVHSTEAYVPLNINQSPFNVGKNVELTDFTAGQVQTLARCYGIDQLESTVNMLLTLVGGHPFLVRKALYHLRRNEFTVAEFKKTSATEAGVYSDHLRRHLLNLQQYPNLAGALRQVVMRNTPVNLESEAAFKLESMGLISWQGNEALPRCDVYRQYFRDHLNLGKA
ncbi:AAA-like domain-containing protein [Acaryochloris sp. IP29b_bin.137]|uniref:AAA-like domain-containing protein n=1 Tax=Acaryochloris sp. IP29b_bin.137 TaxID=2969217 RepID=UPI00260A597F|nr:AAA-like domain-containing protein [Acaryochloris sp. IP29b_bin.137]